MSPDEELELIEIELELARKGKRGTPPPAAPEAPPAEPTMWEKAREGVKSAGRSLMDMSRTQQDAGVAALRGASLGLDDKIAALTARAGGLVQRQRDSDDMVGAGGGESVLESWRATEPLGDEARAERRAEVEAAKKRSPLAAGGAELGAMLATSIAAPGASGGRLAQFASNVVTGGIAGVGMGDAEGEDAEADGIIGAGIGALPAAAGVAGRGGKAVYRAARGVLRPRAAPSSSMLAGAAGKGADVLEALTKGAAEANPILRSAAAMASGGTSEAGIGAAKILGSGLRRLSPKPTPTPPARPEWMAGLTDDVGTVADDASGLELGRVLRPKQKPLPEFDVDVVDDLDPIAVQADDIVEEVATASPPLQPDDVMVTPQRAPAPTPPAPAPAGPVATDLRRSTLGRRATQTEIRNAVEAVAIRDGNASIEHLTNQIGAPTGEIQAVLAPMMRDFNFREAVKAGVRPAGGASSAIAEADEMGRTIRDAQQGARSPIDNVSGRKADQVFAVQQQERWRSAYDALPAEQRAAFVQQLRATSGLSDDAVRQRLRMTKAEWRRTSFERSKEAAPMAEMPQRRPVLRPKATAP